MEKDASLPKIVDLLVQVADVDTVYRDVYLRRAGQHVSRILPESAFRARDAMQKGMDDLLGQSRAATFRRDWARAAELAAEVESRRKAVAATAAGATVAERVYNAAPVALDPFSPGLPGTSGSGKGQQVRPQQLAEVLAALASTDAPLRAFYEARRTHFSRLTMASPDEASRTGPGDRARLEQLAFEAAERGDASRLRQLAEELRREGAAPASTTTGGAGAPTTTGGPEALTPYECPVDLDIPFPEDVVERARGLGLAATRTAPLLDVALLREFLYTRVLRPPADTETEREGILRAEALAAQGLPSAVAEDRKVLVGQFMMHIFVNSGGARYLPPPARETVLIEDFPEADGTDTPTALPSALGLTRRHGLARAEIEDALLRRGASILQEQLHLDPLEFRLVCIPYDLYTRFGHDRGWGKWAHWTHFDGYQIMRTGRLRALAGGDGRYGGLLDLVSLSPTDAREGVIARFAVVRRARMVARWR